jgi:hypothetical protein
MTSHFLDYGFHTVVKLIDTSPLYWTVINTYVDDLGSISSTCLRAAFACADSRSIKRLTTLLSFLRFWAQRVDEIEPWYEKTLTLMIHLVQLTLPVIETLTS